MNMETECSKGKFKDLKLGDHGDLKGFQHHSLRRRENQSHDAEISSALPRWIVQVPESREDVSISLIAGILTEMTTLLRKREMRF